GINMDYIKTEWKKLGGMGLVGVGAFLILEHIYTYGGLDLWDLLGHEWLGIVLVLVGILTANRWGALRMKEGLALVSSKVNYILGRD
ncbi:hypothetical protein LCGC14_3072540, partial [marine sediment metagenome]